MLIDGGSMVPQETSAETHVAVVEHEGLVRCESPHRAVEAHREGGVRSDAPPLPRLTEATQAEAARGRQIGRLGDPEVAPSRPLEIPRLERASEARSLHRRGRRARHPVEVPDHRGI